MHVKRIVLLCLLMIVVGKFGSAQVFNLGAKYSIGKNRYKQVSEGEKINGSIQSNYGISIGFSPFLSYFSFETAVEFQKNKLCNYLTLPLGVRITLGNKIQFFVQVGGYYSVLLQNKSDGYNGKNDAGIHSGIGIGYSLNKKWRLEAEYTGNFGLTPSIQKEILLPVDQISYEDYTLSSHQFSFCAKYRF